MGSFDLLSDVLCDQTPDTARDRQEGDCALEKLAPRPSGHEHNQGIQLSLGQKSEYTALNRGDRGQRPNTVHTWRVAPITDEFHSRSFMRRLCSAVDLL